MSGFLNSFVNATGAIDNRRAEICATEIDGAHQITMLGFGHRVLLGDLVTRFQIDFFCGEALPSEP